MNTDCLLVILGRRGRPFSFFHRFGEPENLV